MHSVLLRELSRSCLCFTNVRSVVQRGSVTWARTFNGSVACFTVKTVGKTMLFGFPKVLGKQNKKQHEKLLVLAA